MRTVYEFWQDRETGEIWAVKLTDGRVEGATQLGRQDVHEELLPHLAYRPEEVGHLNRDRDDFKRIDGRKVA